MSVATTFHAIRQLLQPAKIVASSGSSLIITESGKQATMRSIQLDGVGAHAFFIQHDKCGFPGNASFAPHGSLHRGCDAIGFCEVDGDPFILFIELKSYEPTLPDVSQQFLAAECFLRYLSILLERYCNCDDILRWPQRYFVFHNQAATPLSKKAIRPDFDNSQPDRPMFLPVNSGAKAYARQLLNRPL